MPKNQTLDEFYSTFREEVLCASDTETTASIFNAKNDRKIATDLSQVFVQMKISVIHSADDMDEIVPRISTFANTQNKIQVADFSANDPFHRRIEELSRTIWAPAQGGMKPRNWFYERARGQYADMLTRESTTKRKKEYKETHPFFYQNRPRQVRKHMGPAPMAGQ